MRLNDATPRPVTSACRAVLAGGHFTPSARTRPPPRTIVSCGYRENTIDRFSAHREYLSLFPRARHVVVEDGEEGEANLILAANFGNFNFQNWNFTVGWIDERIRIDRIFNLVL